MEISKKTFIKLPEVPGVYTFWQNKTPIYIGKSINLKSRLNSYLDLNLSIKTAQMIKEADDMTYIELTSDLESLLLESHQIKKYKPKYNILLKDDKHALYIVITNEEFPRVLSCRKLYASSFKNAYGPFPNSTRVKYILKMIRKIFPYSDHKISKRPCLYSHLGLCNPCPNEIVEYKDINVSSEKKKQYKNNIRNIKLVLGRKFNIVRRNLEKEMNILSKQQRYEEAVLIRERIKTLDYITQEKIDTQEFLQNPNLASDMRNEELGSLKKLISTHYSLVYNLKRIECFDIAHLSGVSATASMVVLTNGEKDNSEYKHFKILQKKGQSDYDSMREVAQRRASHIDDPTTLKLRGASWGRPDLIIVDGGLGQVKIFYEVFSKLDIPVVGIAKHPDRLVFPDGTKIRLQGKPLHLISRIRDEAHRFARRYHHLLLSKKLLD